jgi:hypothetical protein
MNPRGLTALIVAFSAIPAATSAQEYLPDKAGVESAFTKQEYSPYVGREFPTRVLWGTPICTPWCRWTREP